MGRDLAENFTVARQTFEEADDALGFALSTLCFDGPIEQLKQTEFTQPAIFTVSVAVDRVLRNHNVVPTHVAGHSLGEYSAAVAAGMLSLPMRSKRSSCATLHAGSRTRRRRRDGCHPRPDR